MSRIENLKKFLRNSGLLGEKFFDNGRELIYSEGGLRVLISYFSNYVVILWLDE